MERHGASAATVATDKRPTSRSPRHGLVLALALHGPAEVTQHLIYRGSQHCNAQQLVPWSRL